MKKTRKGRSKRNAKLHSVAETEELKGAPHTFVFHRGTRCLNMHLLIKDLRNMLEPFTATKLHVTRKNILKDITSIAGLFHVSHLWILSRSTNQMCIRIAGLPAGPTVKFRIKEFTHVQDINNAMRKPINTHGLFNAAPLLVMSAAPGIVKSKESKLISTIFQRSFPSLNVNSVKLNQVRRCVLLHQLFDDTYQLRHYAIKCKLTKEVSSAVRRLLDGRALPDLSNCSDVSDFIYRPSASDSEDDERIELPQEINRLQRKGSQSAIRLVEIGPRLNLELALIEDDVCQGNRLWPLKTNILE